MTDRNSTRRNAYGVETTLTHTGRHPAADRGYVNTPVYRGSTILFSTLDDLESTEPRFDYGRTGNPSSAAVEELVSELEGAAGTVLAPSGLSAITLALLTVLNAGDERAGQRQRLPADPPRLRRRARPASASRCAITTRASAPASQR